MKNRILWCFLILLFGKKLGAVPSLLFQDKEIERIQESLPEKALRTSEVIAGKWESLTLFGIMYLDQDHWTVWVNNKTIGPKSPHNFAGVHLERITPTKVDFSWTSADGKRTQPFTLHPFQTYILKQQKIVDGREN